MGTKKEEEEEEEEEEETRNGERHRRRWKLTETVDPKSFGSVPEISHFSSYINIIYIKFYFIFLF